MPSPVWSSIFKEIRYNLTDRTDLLRLRQGYNFKSLQEISPFLEPQGSGITALWAQTLALKLNCVVTIGYPEKEDIEEKWPTSPEYYNSVIVVNPDGETIANYRKTFLYYTDETWALEGPQGFYGGSIPQLGTTAMGICRSHSIQTSYWPRRLTRAFRHGYQVGFIVNTRWVEY